MVKIRLTRMGSKRNAFYRVVAVDSRTKRDGKYIEQIGTYNPIAGEVNINEATAMKWLGLGAQPTDTVKKILSHEGIMTKFHNTKFNSNIDAVSKSGTTFGATVDTTVGYTAPGTGAKVEEVAEEVVEEIVADAVEAAQAEEATEEVATEEEAA